MVTWILERDIFGENCMDVMTGHCRENNIPVRTISVSSDREIIGRVPVVSGPVVLYGSIGIQDVAARYGWSPGVWTSSDEFNYVAYRDALGDLLLNKDCEVMGMNQVAAYARSRSGSFFIKPLYDTKEFAGRLIESSEFECWHRRMIEIGYLDGKDFDVVVSEPKVLRREWRVVVVGDKISSSSLYKNTKELGIITEVRDLVMEAHSKYRPALVYVIDIAETDNGFKVIEYNTFNSADMYACDAGKIIDDINEMIG